MKTLDEIREEVQEADRREFDKRVAGIRKKVYDAIESFGMTPGVDYEEGLCRINIQRNNRHFGTWCNFTVIQRLSSLRGKIVLPWSCRNHRACPL